MTAIPSSQNTGNHSFKSLLGNVSFHNWFLYWACIVGPSFYVRFATTFSFSPHSPCGWEYKSTFLTQAADFQWVYACVVVFLCVYLYFSMFGSTRVCHCMCVPVCGKWKLMSDIFRNFSSFYLWSFDISLNPEITNPSILDKPFAVWTTHLCPPGHKITNTHHTFQFFHGFWGPKLWSVQ